MATTALVAEILAIGIQTLIWIGLAVFAFFSFDVARLNALFKDTDNWVAVVAAAALALAYSLGVMVDRLADSLLDRFSKPQKLAILEKNGFAKDKDLGKMRMRVLAGPAEVANFLEYIRGRLRLMRSTVGTPFRSRSSERSSPRCG